MNVYLSFKAMQRSLKAFVFECMMLYLKWFYISNRIKAKEVVEHNSCQYGFNELTKLLLTNGKIWSIRAIFKRPL